METEKPLIEFLKERINHPFLGSFIFAFLTLNYDILYLLIMNSKSKDAYAALALFKGSLIGNSFYRFGIPFSVMLFNGFALPFIDSAYQKFIAWVLAIRKNWIEKSSLASIKFQNDQLTAKFESVSNELEVLKSILADVWWFSFSALNSNSDQYGYFLCVSGVKINSLVSINANQTAVPLNPNNRSEFYGEVVSIWQNKYVVVKRISSIGKYLDKRNETFKLGSVYLEPNSYKVTYSSEDNKNILIGVASQGDNEVLFQDIMKGKSIDLATRKKIAMSLINPIVSGARHLTIT